MKNFLLLLLVLLASCATSQLEKKRVPANFYDSEVLDKEKPKLAEACSLATKRQSSFELCVDQGYFNPSLTPEKIITCGQTTTLNANFRDCLKKGSDADINAGQLMACSKLSSVLGEYQYCLEYLNHQLTAEKVTWCINNQRTSIRDCLSKYSNND